MFKLVNQVKFGTPNHNGGKSRVSAAHVVLEKKQKKTEQLITENTRGRDWVCVTIHSFVRILDIIYNLIHT